MKTSSLLFIVAGGIVLSFCAVCTGKTITVNAAGGADFTSIQAAISDAGTVNGDQIQVAPGTYNEAINFLGKAVRLYSSSGAEATVIDGNDTHRVVQCISDEDPNTILEGFTITRGYADKGAGMYNYHSSPTVINCQFYWNTTTDGVTGTSDGTDAGNGAGMYNELSSPTISNCTFMRNITGKGGNGKNAKYNFFNEGKNGGHGGHGGNGGGIFNSYSNPTVTECRFILNETGGGGNGGSGALGGSFLGGLPGGNGGYAGNGGNGAGIFNFQSSPLVSDCEFINNGTGTGGKGGKYGLGGGGSDGFGAPGNSGNGGHGGSGAGISNHDSLPAVHHCIFSVNWTGNGGEGGDGRKEESGWLSIVAPALIGFTYSKIGLPDVNLENAYAGIGGNSGYGAGVFCSQSSITVTDCVFNWNETGYGGNSVNGTGKDGAGAGVCNIYSDTNITNCTFKYNSSDFGGGAVNIISNPIFAGCVFIQNTAHQDGSGMYNYQSHSTVTNCTFFGDSAYRKGGGVYNDQSNPVLTNCIFWDNNASIDNDISNSNSSPVITYCNVGADDPLFEDIEGRLSAASPCQGAGNNNAPGLPERDLDGNFRIIGTAVDLGAFEYTDLTIHNITKDTFYGRIQPAINDASAGDEICVLPGTYNEAINFNGRAVRLYSISGPELTAINGSGAYHVVQCVSGEGANTILEGFTITGGNANGTSSSENLGGGMYIAAGSSPTVTGCVFSGNSAYYGGAMYNNEYCSPTVTDCIFTGNTASTGGGIYNFQYSNPTVTDCIFSSNTVAYAGAGIVNYNFSNAKVTNCVFNNNTANFYGGAMFNVNDSQPTVTNCTFSGNSANWYGDGIYNSSSNPIVINSILWDASSDEIYNVSSTPVVTYCDIQGGYSGMGNINLNPLFVDPGNGDFRFLSSYSPCVEAGDSTAAGISDTDAEGNPRFYDGNMDGTEAIDMGAFEFIGRVNNLSQVIVYHNIQDAIDEAVDGERIVAMPGTYYENINFKGKNIILKSIDPNDAATVQQTILDGQHAGSVVTFSSNEDPNCILAGFTIRHGKVNFFEHTHGGAGIYYYQSSPTIEDCVIYANQAIMITGSGIYCDGASPRISRCIVNNNTSIGTTEPPGDFVGTVVFDNGSNAVFEDCTIAKNEALEAAGLLCLNSTLTIDRGNIQENVSSALAGGIYSQQSDVSVKDCVVAYNTGGYGAGGIECNGGNLAISHSTITVNVSNYLGGGVAGCTGAIENCTITNNTASWNGGGLYDCTGPVTNCFISGNDAGTTGGGISGSMGPIVNCVITNNSVDRGGAGLSDCDNLISNCTIIGNRAKSIYYTEGGGLRNCTGNITNCIIGSNYAATSEHQLYSCSVPNYSCIEGWTGGGTRNIAANPNFRQDGYWAHVDDPNIILEPDDPNAMWVEGQYQLGRNSPCIDAGNNSAVPVSVTLDLNGWSRFIDNLCVADTGLGTAPIVDMGVYEFLPADIDGSGSVNYADFEVLSSYWLQSGVDYHFQDLFEDSDPNDYTFEDSYHSGGSFTISGGNLNITTTYDNTASVMTSQTVDFGIGDTLSLDVPAVSGDQGVFMMCSTTAGQPNGTSTFGFRFRRDGGGLYARMHLFPGGLQANTADPSPDDPATLNVTRISDTNFAYSIAIEGAETYLGSFTLAELSGITSLHIGAQAYDNSWSNTFSFDNLQVGQLTGADLDGDNYIGLNDLLEFVEWWLTSSQ